MCWSHVMGNVQNKYRFKASKTNKKLLQKDLRNLHLAKDENTFDVGCALFIQKWGSKEPEVVSKLEKSFFKKCKNWYIGAGIQVPITNNLLERFNGKLKQTQTFHQQRATKMFVNDLLKITSQRSVEYKMDKRPFETNVPVSTADLRKGCALNVHFESKQTENECEFFCFASHIDKDITQEDIEEFENNTYETFDEFAEKHCSIWRVTFPVHDIDIRNAHCTCPAFNDDYTCKHIISIGHKLGCIQAPAEDYDDEPLFGTLIGRPPKASKNPLSKT